MRLTVFTDYSLRVLIYLALFPDRKVRIREVAEEYGISKNHLMKVVNKLAHARFVHSTRGVNGGLLLARPADTITVGEVILKCEDDFAVAECFRSDNHCVITPACELKDVFARARDAFMSVLDEYTIAQMAHNRDALLQHLETAAPAMATSVLDLHEARPPEM